MEALPENTFESVINLSRFPKLDSAKLETNFLLSCFIDDNMFKITAQNEDYEDEYLIQFTMPDWAKRKEKEFTKRIKNFKLLVEAIREAFEKKRLTLYNDGFSLLLTLYYTIIFKEEQISFELHKKMEDPEEEKRLIGQFFSTSEPIDEEKSWDYRAELIDYSKNFEDYGSRRSIIRVKIKNAGTTTWYRKMTSFKCVKEFSSLLCNEYILEEDVIPGDDIEFNLEFMKGEPDNFEPPYFTFLHLHVYPKNYEPMLILDFNESFKDEINRTNLTLDKNKLNEKDDINLKKGKNKKANKNKKEEDSDDGNEINMNIESNNIINEKKNSDDEENENKIFIKKEKIKEENLENQPSSIKNIIDYNEEIKDEIKINMDEGKKNNIVFNNVKVNISFNVENSNKIICIDVNERQVKFNVDDNQVKIIDNQKNKIHVEDKKPIKQIKPVNKIKEKKEEKNSIKDNKNPKENEFRQSLQDRIKFFNQKK